MTGWLPRLVARVPAAVHAKLLVSFLAIAALLIVLGVVGLEVLRGVNDRAEDLVKLQQKIAAYRELQRDVSLPSSWTWNERTLEAARSQLTQFRHDFDRLPSVPPEESAALAAVRQAHDRFAAVLDELVQLTRAGQATAARELQLARATPLAEALERLTNEVVNRAEVDMAGRIRETQEAYAASRRMVIGFAVGSIALALVLGYAISWSLIGPVKLMDARLRLVASGDFSQRVEVPNRDELGDLAAQFNRMAAQLAGSYAALRERTRELSESLEQQTATSEILRVFSRSPTDVQPVFEAIVANGARLCEGEQCLLVGLDGETLVHLASHNFSGNEAALRALFPAPLTRRYMSGRAILEHQAVHVPDIATDPEYGPKDLASMVGYRAGIGIPLMRESRPIGALVVTRHSVGRFSPRQVDLLQTFADQAVIAIENIRLFTELQARTAELTRSVERLTALGEVGRAVSSTLDIDTVLRTIVSRASQLASADAGAIYEYDEATDEFHVRATHHFTPEVVAASQAAPLRKGEGLMGRAAERHTPIQVPDITAPGTYRSRLRDALVGAGYRALLSVPLLREDRVLGSLSLARRAPGEFSVEVVELLETLATQSALAIQNARLFLEIAEKSRQLEVASRHKSEFLANMSHELRTPLNAIIGFSEVLTERMFGELNDKQDEYLRDIYASGQHLLSLINDILDLSKIEAGRMELELSDFDLSDAIDGALTLVRERAVRRGIALRMTADERVGLVRADARKIRQVILNLLSNAVKFTPEGGCVEVGAMAVDGAVEVAVRDTGVGIAPDEQEAVFEEFRQVGASAAKQEGTGLGLALCRKFVELHGGRIWVASAVGIGSTFTFRIPVRA